MLQITDQIGILEKEMELSAIHSQGAGGQNVNKVATAIHLRFDIQASSLPELYKNRLMGLKDHRITREGIVVIKAQQFRSQEKNHKDARQRLRELILSVMVAPKKRRATKPSKRSQIRRMDQKSRRGKVKSLRSDVSTDV